MKAEVREFMSQNGKKGSAIRWSKQSPEERSAFMKEIRRKGIENKKKKYGKLVSEQPKED